MLKRTKIIELFNTTPDQWGLRGDPYLWQEIKMKLAHIDMPATEQALNQLLFQTYQAATGYPISYQQPFPVERFNHGGMSSGFVDPVYWSNHLIPLLLERYIALR